MHFRWNRWNIEHIAEHGVTPDEAAYVVEHARSPFPRYDGDGKYRAWGQTAAGEYLQVVFVFDPANVAFVIHARPLNDSEKRLFRRKRK